MRFSTFQAAIGSASILFSAQPAAASLGHRHSHDHHARRHGHGHAHGRLFSAPKVARKATCSLPDHPDLVRVSGQDNNGFAMSPDEPCEDGKWCPIACKSGKLMAQWKPGTKQVYPESMYGGLYCNGGKPEKPFDKDPYCVDGTGAVKAVNEAGSIVSFCQTVLPGNEAMLIPTDVTDSVTLAVPGPDYWAGTAAHYYVNSPGIPASKGCVWGTITEPVGNWSPFVAGANTLGNGNTFVKIAWNPEFLGADLANTTPSYGLKIECPGGGCNGLPCVIDPSKGGVGGLDSPVATKGKSDAAFCVVTVPKGKTANIVVFNTDGGSKDKPDKPDDKPDDTPTPKEPEPTKKPTTVAKPTTTAAETTAAADSPSPTPSPTKDEKSDSDSESDDEEEASSVTTVDEPSTTKEAAWVGGVFQEKEVLGEIKNYAGGADAPGPTPQPGQPQTPDAVGAAALTESNEGAAAAEGGCAIAGLVVALVAAAALF